MVAFDWLKQGVKIGCSILQTGLTNCKKVEVLALLLFEVPGSPFILGTSQMVFFHKGNDLEEVPIARMEIGKKVTG